MTDINKKLNHLKLKQDTIKIMILGLGSVGAYLLQYLCELQDPGIEFIVVGRNHEKMESDVNIITIAASIRGCLKSHVQIEAGCDFEEIEAIRDCFVRYQPDLVINSSRVYSGLKYGSISWNQFRAYGIWTPLAMKYIRNIMKAAELADSKAIIINTSYSDAVIPWLKSAGWPYPDFGSGNLNHLVPRLKRAAAEYAGIADFWKIEAVIATGHFHDVVISKEGQNEGVSQLISLSYKGRPLQIQEEELLKRCRIAMPTDEKRNMMNASSNFQIISAVLAAVRDGKKVRVHSPGVFGRLGGYPVWIDGAGTEPCAYIDESCFTIEEMDVNNQKSMILDGIEAIHDGCLVYSDRLIHAVKEHYQVSLPKKITFDEIDQTADWIIEHIIKRQ